MVIVSVLRLHISILRHGLSVTIGLDNSVSELNRTVCMPAFWDHWEPMTVCQQLADMRTFLFSSAILAWREQFRNTCIYWKRWPKVFICKKWLKLSTHVHLTKKHQYTVCYVLASHWVKIVMRTWMSHRQWLFTSSSFVLVWLIIVA